jgi:hypothetical protein
VFLLLLLAPVKVTLTPALPVVAAAAVRWQPKLAPDVTWLARLLADCASGAGTKPHRAAPVEIRLVARQWLDQMFPPPPGWRRAGRYYPAAAGHKALIYASVGAGLKLTIAHEWLHHLMHNSDEKRSEAWIEAAAKACFSASPTPTIRRARRVPDRP